MNVQILIGDALTRLREIPDESVDCCITSPPYWGLRDYGVEGQLGLEPTLGEHLDALVELFAEVWRVLKPHGSLWLNYGDCYATAPNGRSAAETKAEGVDDRTFRDKPFSTVGPIYPPQPGQHRIGMHRAGGGNNPAGPVYVAHTEEQRAARGPANQSFKDANRNTPAPPGRIAAGGVLKPKDLCMIPNRLAIALQDWGWWVRSEIVWGKRNAMPDSSGVARPSTAHEKIFLLTKSGDADVWRARDTGQLSFSPDLTEQCPLVTKPHEMGARWSRLGSYYDASAVMMPVSGTSRPRAPKVKMPDGWASHQGGHGSIHRDGREAGKTISTSPKTAPAGDPFIRGNERYRESMIEQPDTRLLRNYEPDVSALVPVEVWDIPTASFADAHFATFTPELVVPCVLGGSPVGGVVLDPFGGAGTTGLVAARLGRDAILIELNPEYAEMADARLRAAMVPVSGVVSRPKPIGGLFAAQEGAA